MSQSRQLAAIMFTDIVGYTALMGNDEQKAFQLLKKNREIQKPLIKQYNGTWIKELGDGVLASFHTVTDAVFCAAAIHQSCNKVEGLQLRIGIHLGEVIFEDNDVFGDGVNIASRLQAMASIGSTWVSEAVYKNLVNKKEITSEFIKEETLKNVSEPVKVYEITVKEIPGYLPDNIKAYQQQRSADSPVKKKNILISVLVLLAVSSAAYFVFFNKKSNRDGKDSVILEKSIAVIPFKNLSSEKENQYFADGMMDEILNKLSKINDLRVIPRTSVEQYRDTKKSIKEIAGELDVAYILEGSAQKYGDEIKVIVKLIDAAKSEGHLWSDNYIKPYKEVFALQNEIAGNIVKELEAKMTPQENELVNKAAATNTEAYDFYLRGREYISKYGSTNNEKDLDNAKSLFHRALHVDSAFSLAWVGLGSEYLERNKNAAEFLTENYLDSALYFCNKALSFDAALTEAYELRGRFYQRIGKNGNAFSDFERAILIDPNNFSALWNLGSHYFLKKDYLNSLKYYTKTKVLIKGGNLLPNLLIDIAFIHASIGNFKTADSLTERAINLKPDLQWAYNMMWWSSTLQGKLDKALLYAQKQVEFSTASTWAFGVLTDSYAFLKDFENSLIYLEKAEEERRKAGDIRISNLHRVGYILWNTGKKAEARKYFDDQIKTIKEAIKFGRQEDAFNYELAATYAFIGNESRALEHLKAYEKDGFNKGTEYYIMVDPLFESLRSNKEFKEIIGRAQAQKTEIRARVKELEAKGEL